jgi:hypothetical protein
MAIILFRRYYQMNTEIFENGVFGDHSSLPVNYPNFFGNPYRVASAEGEESSQTR